MRPEFDAMDGELLARREREFNLVNGPRVGDFLRTADGLLRFTHDWDDTIQTTVSPRHPCNGDASFYLSDDGHVSFSGSLDPGIDKEQLRDTGETEEGYFWFFHHNYACAYNGVTFKIPCRVFELIPVSHDEPTYANQLWHARKLLREHGYRALDNPHGMTGRSCGCGECFCCAAAQVLRELEQA